MPPSRILYSYLHLQSPPTPNAAQRPRSSFFSASMSPILASLCFVFFFAPLPGLLGLTNPDPATVQQFLPGQAPPATIPAFPEQSDVSSCPLELPDELFRGVEVSCGAASAKDGAGGALQRSRCCPVLAAWLYAAYSATALGRAGHVVPAAAHADQPLLPDDSETCVDGMEKNLKARGIALMRPNDTCDLMYCFCGIRLHPLTCPEAFSVNQKGKIVAGDNVKRLERDCLSGAGNLHKFPGLGGCNKCLNTLHLLHQNKSSSSSKSGDRTTKMHNKDCQLMGLTWLLAKNRTAYMQTVSAVLRAIMMSPAGTLPRSCSLNSDGMPLAVDSSRFPDQSSSLILQPFTYISIAFICLLYMQLQFFIA